MTYGLNDYARNPSTLFGFTNFQWVLPGAVARSSQPNYTNKDRPHDITFPQIDYLKRQGIRCIISSNEYGLSDRVKSNLSTYGISYYHFKVKDFQPASPEQLRTAADIIESHRRQNMATLVYCGYGQGRTGTIVSAWAVMKYLAKRNDVDLDALCVRDRLKQLFGLETPEQAMSIRAAKGLPQTAPMNTAPTMLFPPSPGVIPPPPVSPPNFAMFSMSQSSGAPSSIGAPSSFGAVNSVGAPGGIGAPDDMSVSSFSPPMSGPSWSPLSF